MILGLEILKDKRWLDRFKNLIVNIYNTLKIFFFTLLWIYENITANKR